jgi:alkylated DNA repair dioxygenase AlkB
MYDKVLDEPRLHGAIDPEVRPAVVERARVLLSDRYGVDFTSVRANLYRDGRDSVAWHGDRVARDLPNAYVATVSLGARRRFLLRPTGGGRSVRFEPGPGDLLVMGGTCQRDWQHTVPKVAHAEPRISLTFRHAYE